MRIKFSGLVRLVHISLGSSLLLANFANADGWWENNTPAQRELNLSKVVYAEVGSLRSKSEVPNPVGGGNIPPGKGQYGYSWPHSAVRKDIVHRILCRLHRGKKPGTATPSAGGAYDPSSSTPSIKQQSEAANKAVKDAQAEFDAMSSTEKDKKCGTRTHFWHECVRFDAQGAETTVTGSSAQWILDLKKKDSNYVCGYPKTKNASGDMVPTYLWDGANDCWLRHCTNLVKVAL